MKVKALSRSARQSTRECVGDVKKVSRNLNPNHHPMQKAREYTRAVTSAKLERMFAKPFCHSLEGHMDGVMVTCPSKKSLRVMVSGSADGEVRVWDLASQKGMVAYTRAHSGWVTGLVENPSPGEGPSFYSCGLDGYVKLWDMNGSGSTSDDPEADGLLNTWRYENGSLKCIDHHWTEEQFATASDHAVDLWNPHRATPIQSFSLWGTDSVNVVKYNPSERYLLGK